MLILHETLFILSDCVKNYKLFVYHPLICSQSYIIPFLDATYFSLDLIDIKQRISGVKISNYLGWEPAFK